MKWRGDYRRILYRDSGRNQRWTLSIETILKGRMARRKIDVKKVVVVERKPRRQSVFIVARTKRGGVPLKRDGRDCK